MRAVDYVTNGFGGFSEAIQSAVRGGMLFPVPDPYSGSFYTKEQVALRGPRETPRAFPPAPFSDYAVLQAFNDQQLFDPIASAGLQTYKSRGIGGIDQAVNFFEALLQGFEAYGKMGLFEADQRRMGFEKALVDAFRKVFNTAASRTGSNPLTNAIRDQILKRLQGNVEREARMIFYSLPFIYSSLVDVRRRLTR